MKTMARNVVSTFKNRLIPLRYFYKGMNALGAYWTHPRSRCLPETTDEFTRLESEGYYESMSDLPKAKLDALQMLAAERAGNCPSHRYNNYPFADLLLEDDFRNLDNPIIDFVFSEQLLTAAAWYFQGAPKLTRCFLAYTKPDPSRDWRQTQLWHIDSDDFKILRVVLYLSDIDESAGPFMFVPKSASWRMGKLWAGRLDDAEFAKHYGDEGPPVRVFTGQPGRMLMIDTAKCNHCGSRATTKERLSLVVTFTTRTPCNNMHPLIRAHARTMYRSLRQSKPDIPDALLRSLLL